MTRRLLRALVAFVLAVAVTSAVRPAGGADESTTAATEPVLDQHSVQVAIDLARTSRQLAETERRLDVTGQQRASAQQIVDVTDGFIAGNRREIESLKAVLRENALTAYQRHSSSAGAPIAVQHVDLRRTSRSERRSRS